MSYNSEVHLALGEKVVCAAVSPLLYTLPYMQVQWYLPLQQPHFNFPDFNNGDFYVMKITIAESNPDDNKHFVLALALTFWLEPIRCR